LSLSPRCTGEGIPIGLGAAFKSKYRKDVLGDESSDSVTCSFFGDGTCNVGQFYECLNMAVRGGVGVSCFLAARGGGGGGGAGLSHSPLLARETGFAPPTGRFSVAPFLRARALTNQPPPQQQTPNKKQALYKLPHIFVVENNKWAIGMNHPRATAPTSGDGEPFIYKKGAAFGMPGVLVDGMDVLKVRFIVFCFYSRAFGRREGGKRDARAVGPGPGCAPPFVPARIPFFFSASSLFGVRFARALPLLPFFCCPFFLLPLFFAAPPSHDPPPRDKTNFVSFKRRSARSPPRPSPAPAAATAPR